MSGSTPLIPSPKRSGILHKCRQAGPQLLETESVDPTSESTASEVRCPTGSLLIVDLRFLDARNFYADYLTQMGRRVVTARDIPVIAVSAGRMSRDRARAASVRLSRSTVLARAGRREVRVLARSCAGSIPAHMSQGEGCNRD